MEKLKIGVVGLGLRGRIITEGILADMCKNDVEIVTVCDRVEERAVNMAAKLNEKIGYRPKATADYRDLLNDATIQAVIIMTSWPTHIPFAIEAMAAGKYVGMEVCGAYSIKQCWDLVDAGKRYGNRFMFLENCCYGKRELMALRMKREGFFGDVVHCSGGYMHDLRSEIMSGKELRHYRLGNYLHRNTENYPTHELGPIAKLLDINNGNRMLSLTCTASRGAGLQAYAREHCPEDSPLRDAVFLQGDVVTTVIKCARGETITLQLDTTLPRYYSRGFTVRGTKAAYLGETDCIWEDGKMDEYEFKGNELWGNAAQYEASYTHPIWQNYEPTGGHDGMDWLVYRAFVEAAKADKHPPVDLYDAVAYMCITPLCEESLAKGSAPVAIPDFTEGRWFTRDDIDYDDVYALDTKQPLRDYCI